MTTNQRAKESPAPGRGAGARRALGIFVLAIIAAAGACKSSGPEAGPRPDSPAGPPSAAPAAGAAHPAPVADAGLPPSDDARQLLQEMLLDETSGPPARHQDGDRAPEGDRRDADLEEALEVLAKAAGGDETGAGKSGAGGADPVTRGGPPAESSAAVHAPQPPPGPAPGAPAPAAPAPAASSPDLAKAQPQNGGIAPSPAGQSPAAPSPAAQAPAPAPQTPPAQPPAQAPAQTPPAPAPAPQAPAKPPRPPGKSSFYTLFHKNADEFLRFLSEQFADLVQKGHVVAIEGQPRSVVFFGDDATLGLLESLANEFDDLALKLERVIIRPKFVDPATAMESLSMAGVANVWNRVEEEVTTNMMGADGKVAKTYSRKQNVYARNAFATGVATPAIVPAKVPYVFEMPSADPLQLPPVSTGKGITDQLTVDFRNISSTERRGSIVAVGTGQDLERIQEFIESIDQPARLVMLEVQLIELDANKFSDIGTDAFQFGAGHTIVGGALNFPGEPIPQPGIPGAPRRDPNIFVPPNVASGITGMFDDTTVDLPGRFMANVHLLLRTGDAKIKARPKILALDDRPSILHIGEDLPTFDSTGVNREVTGGNFVETVNRVTTQYVGFTLNMRPRITGEKEDEVSLLLEVVSSRLQARERVFAEDLLGIPNVTRRRFLGQTRVQNHRPIIIGGLIQEEEAESVSKFPVVGELPVLKYLFSRREKSDRRVEVILIITPHILTDRMPDRIATPKESIHFDTFDSVLFNDRYIIKGRDVQGIDPISKQPATADGKVFTEAEVIDLTLLKIVKDRKLVSKLGILDEYLPGEAGRLGWFQRKYPERTVRYWRSDKRDIYFKAAAVVIENIKELNPDLTYEELVKPRREIVLPTTPYRMTLSYDKYRILKEEGQYLLRGERVEASPATVEILKEVAESRSVREFADYLQRAGVKAENHGDLRVELERLAAKLHPAEDLKGGDYPGLFRKLANLQIDFMVIATYFQDNLADRYSTSGAPNIGSFEKDVVNFLKTAVTITQRAKRLRDLERRWDTVASDEETEAGAAHESQPEAGPPGREGR